MLCSAGIYGTGHTILGSICEKRTIVGLTRGVNRYHIIRATLESLAYQVNDVLVVMKADSGIELAALKVDGGASANDFLMQTQADLISCPGQATEMCRDNSNGSSLSCRTCDRILEQQGRSNKELGNRQDI